MIILSDRELGGVILGISWCMNSISGLCVATAVVRRFGYKYSMILSMLGYAFQISTLYLAIVCREAAWPIAISGSLAAGVTSAIWWTAQGVCFELTCGNINDLYESLSEEEREKGRTSMANIRADLSAHWTIIYQLADILVFLLLSLIPVFLDTPISTVVLALCFLGFTTTFLGFTFDALGFQSSSQSWSEIYEGVVAAPIQFRQDARASLLAPFVFGFGITTAMFSYYVNAEVISDSSNLGVVTLGFLEAFSYAVAVVSAFPYAYVSNHYTHGQDAVIQFGSASFLLSGLAVLCFSNHDLSQWSSILVVKGLYGLGRGVFEGSCRAVYAQLFTGKDLSTAFSGQTLLAGFSGGICFFLFGVLSRTGIAAITVANGVVAIAFYFWLINLDVHQVISWNRLFGLEEESAPVAKATGIKYKVRIRNPMLHENLIDEL